MLHPGPRRQAVGHVRRAGKLASRNSRDRRQSHAAPRRAAGEVSAAQLSHVGGARGEGRRAREAVALRRRRIALGVHVQSLGGAPGSHCRCDGVHRCCSHGSPSFRIWQVNADFEPGLAVVDRYNAVEAPRADAPVERATRVSQASSPFVRSSCRRLFKQGGRGWDTDVSCACTVSPSTLTVALQTAR